MGRCFRFLFNSEKVSHYFVNAIVAANAALYSRKLMHHAYLELERFDNIDDPYFLHYDDADPVTILQNSYEESMQEARQEVR
jgi:hypothetical protein